MTEFQAWLRSSLDAVEPFLTKGESDINRVKIEYGQLGLLGVDLIHAMLDLGLMTPDRLNEVRSLIEMGQFGRFSRSAAWAIRDERPTALVPA